MNRRSRPAWPIDLPLVGVLLTAMAFRLWHLDVPLIDAHSWRQITNADIARHFAEGSLDLFHPRDRRGEMECEEGDGHGGVSLRVGTNRLGRPPLLNLSVAHGLRREYNSASKGVTVHGVEVPFSRHFRGLNTENGVKIDLFQSSGLENPLDFQRSTP